MEGIEEVVAKRLVALSSEYNFAVPLNVSMTRTITREQLQAMLNSKELSPVAYDLNKNLSNYVRVERYKRRHGTQGRTSAVKPSRGKVRADELVKIQLKAGTRTLIDRLCDATIPRHKFLESLVQDFSRKEKRLVTELKEQKDEELNHFKGDLAKRSELTKQRNALYNERRFLITLIGFYEGVLTDLLEPEEIKNNIVPKAKRHLLPSNEDVEAALMDTSSDWHLKKFRDTGEYPVQNFIKRYFKARYKE